MSPPLVLVRAREVGGEGCACPEGVAGLPRPSARPWEGPGWLFHCLACRAPFVFGRAVPAPAPLEELARRDLGEEASGEDLGDWVVQLRLLLEHVKPDREYVFLDGAFLPVNALRVDLEGWFADHHLASVPQVEAQRNPALVMAMLANPRYWIEGAQQRAGQTG